MSATTHHETSTDHPFTTLGPDARTYERYAQVDLEENVVLLYDRDHENGWITSDTPVALSAAV